MPLSGCSVCHNPPHVTDSATSFEVNFPCAWATPRSGVLSMFSRRFGPGTQIFVTFSGHRSDRPWFLTCNMFRFKKHKSDKENGDDILR